MSDSFARPRAILAGLARRGRGRVLAPRAGIDFASNDYLGLAAGLELRAAAAEALTRGVPVGSGGSRLLRGNHPEHELLEAEAAAFFGAEAALFLPTGFAANVALLATLPQRGDKVFADELAHASMHEGLALARASHGFFAHNDAAACAAAIAAWRAEGGTGTTWIAIESLYSMDGDTADIAAFGAVAAAHDAVLIVDEAHATGVFGPGGRGLVAQAGRGATTITLHTLGKALGCEGALLTGPAVMRDMLVNRARGFIFSTAPSPLMAAVARASLRLCRAGDDRRAALNARIAAARTHLVPLGATCHGSPIVPLVLGGDARTMAVAGALQSAGFDVRGIRPPTVPEGTGRLRIALTLNVEVSDIVELCGALREALA